jgi:hypothetical protein
VLTALVALLAAFLLGRFTAPKSTVIAAPDPVATSSAVGAVTVQPSPSPSAVDSGDASSTPSDTPTAASPGPAASGADTVSLSTFTPVSGGFDNEDSNPVVNGNSQLYALSAGIDGCNGDTTGDVQYNLGRDYTQFAALLGIDDNSPSQSAAPTVEIDGDGQKLGTWTATLGKPTTLTVNVTNVLRMDIKWTDPGLTCPNGIGQAFLVFGNGQLTPVPGYVATTPSSTTD